MRMRGFDYYINTSGLNVTSYLTSAHPFLPERDYVTFGVALQIQDRSPQYRSRQSASMIGCATRPVLIVATGFGFATRPGSLFDGLQFKTPATGEWPSRSFKVTPFHRFISGNEAHIQTIRTLDKKTENLCRCCHLIGHIAYNFLLVFHCKLKYISVLHRFRDIKLLTLILPKKIRRHMTLTTLTWVTVFNHRTNILLEPTRAQNLTILSLAITEKFNGV